MLRNSAELIGEQMGVSQGKREDALEMLRDGVPMEKISKYTKLSIDEIASLQKDI